MASPCFAVSAAASETDDKVIVSEYEYITSIRAMNDSELEATALTESEIQMIQSNAIENEILARKQLSDAVLMEKYGHTILTISPSVSFPASGGISFGFATDEADSYSGYINVRTATWYNN